MAMNVGSSNGRIAPQMNVTPLVDVVLVLLIIFMVVTPLLTKKFWLHVPKKDESSQAATPPPSDDKPIVLSYRRDGVIRINADVVSREELGDRLRRAIAARSDALVFFDADADADYGEAVRVMDSARGAGAANIAVVTEALTR